MEKLTTVFKFVGAGNGGGSAATDSATSSVATGDITMLIAGIVALLIGAVAIWATVAYRKRAAEGAHIAGSNATFMPLIAAAVAIVLGLGLTIASTSNIKAHAEGAITTTPCIGTVDEQTGSVTFSDVTLTNNSEDPQRIYDDFKFVAADGITGLDDVIWKFEAETIYGEKETLYNNKFGGSVEEDWLPIDVPGKSDVDINSYTISVSATGISPEVAKSLIGKEVAYQTCSYDALYTVSASVDGGSTYGSVSPESLYIVNGTTYKVNGNDIVFGEGDDALTITFTPTEGYKLTNWIVDGAVATSGKVTSNLAFVANAALNLYSGTVNAIDEAGAAATPKDGITVQFTPDDSSKDPVAATTKDGGKYTLEVAPGTEGKVSVISSVDGSVYSAETFATTSKSEAILATITTRKLTSLQTTITDNTTTTETEARTTCWCPVIADDSPISTDNIKFYDYNCNLISDKRADGTAGYSMKDIASTTKETASSGEAYKSQANYFAFCTTGQTFNCFQNVNMPWSKAFTKNDQTAAGIADAVSIDQIKARFTNTNDSFNSVYKDDSDNWIEEWGGWSSKPTDPTSPHVLGYQYFRNGGSDTSQNLVDIYGRLVVDSLNMYNEESKVLTWYSAGCWTSNYLILGGTYSCAWHYYIGSTKLRLDYTLTTGCTCVPVRQAFTS